VQWFRPHEIWKGQEPRIYENGIEPSDVNQGYLGNCYFLASLSALAEFPERIEALFCTKEVNKAGIYAMNFFINGIKQVVIVDDLIPCRVFANSVKPIFANSKSHELWVILLEKAWAKLHGSYKRSESGYPYFSMSHITGVPSQRFLHDDVTTGKIPSINNEADFYEQIKKAD